MNVLMIDTATRVEMVAASSGDRVSDRTGIAGVSHSVTLFQNIQGALEELGITLGDIGLIGVGTGPGSFTGIRIAVSTSRMLAQLMKVPLVGIHSPLVYASGAPGWEGDNILVAFDAKKGRVFGALYRKTAVPCFPREVVPPGDYFPESLAERIPPGCRTIIIGDGAEKYYDRISPLAGEHEIVRDFRPSGISACGLALRLYTASPGSYLSARSVLPFYARKSDAEDALEARRRDQA